MTTIAKPKHCGQSWLEMTPTENGRICGQCSKVIVDFSKKNWAEIEKIQSHNNNSVCGMYKPQQLDFWGQETPSTSKTVLKAAAITSMTISLSLQGYSQTATTNDSIVIKGKVIDKTTGEDLPFANVTLKNSKQGTTTDMQGNFKLVVKNIPMTSLPDTLVVNYVGYISSQLVFKDLKEINNDQRGLQPSDLNLKLEMQSGAIVFYVTEPTLKQRIKRKFKRWFGRKE